MSWKGETKAKEGPVFVFDKGFFTGHGKFLKTPQEMGLVNTGKFDFRLRSKRGDERSKLPEEVKLRNVENVKLSTAGFDPSSSLFAVVPKKSSDRLRGKVKQANEEEKESWNPFLPSVFACG